MNRSGDAGEIRSAANERYRELIELATSARERKARGLTVIEGVHLLQAWIDRHGADAAPPRVFVPRRAGQRAEIQALLERLAQPPLWLDDKLFARASQVEHGDGPIAIVATPRPPLPERLDDDAVYLDRLQDPGNVGSILRTCAAAGVGRVITAPGTAFCWSPKVLRAGMGAHFHLDIHEGVPPDELLQRCALSVRATEAAAGLTIYRADLRPPALWLFGNEGQGLAAAFAAAPGIERLAIPQQPSTESLNVGVAAAVCLYEQWRQRQAARAPLR
ncbi:MAG: TrmH family RNA methyltransferase [Burkholderiaceae bacterium]